MLNLLIPVTWANPQTTQVGRYLTVDNKPTRAQINPLLAVATFHFPPSIKTIGQAIALMLDNTSYALVPKDKRSHAVQETLAKSLPITDRTLGPITIKAALQVLMGVEVFDLKVYYLHREIQFALKPHFAKARNPTQVNAHQHTRAQSDTHTTKTSYNTHSIGVIINEQ